MHNLVLITIALIFACRWYWECLKHQPYFQKKRQLHRIRALGKSTYKTVEIQGHGNKAGFIRNFSNNAPQGRRKVRQKKARRMRK